MLRWGPKYAWSGSRLNSVQPKWEIPVNSAIISILFNSKLELMGTAPQVCDVLHREFTLSSLSV
jgi:hypothetical protein